MAHATAADAIDRRLDALARQPFRAKFRLVGRERGLVELRGRERIRDEAAQLFGARVAPAEPRNDGRQTPYRGHPVFVGQHATATCCRSCLERWHRIPAGHELTAEERAYALDVIDRWIDRQLESKSGEAF
ncbi:MAG: DUF4186 domain-containing protein [Gaiellaceae bacterium]